MAKVKIFRVDKRQGISGDEIREFVNAAEREAVVDVHMLYIPPLEPKDAQVLIIITKLDDLDGVLGHVDIQNEVSQLDKKIEQLQGK